MDMDVVKDSEMMDVEEKTEDIVGEVTAEGAGSQMEEETVKGADGGGEEVEEKSGISFSPPAYIQRYDKVNRTIENFLESPKYKSMFADVGKTVMEVGCAEFGMMKYLKRVLDIGKIMFLDLDKELLKEKSRFLRPLPAEYLQRDSRPQPLVVEAYAGCVTKVDANVYRNNPNIWAIIGIELIEHLHADVLRGFEEAVFGVISPSIVVLTTPNSEFNQVFNLAPGKFRHWDHKFEWSRSEFDSWCKKITAEFQGYDYRIEGVCKGPEGTEHLGCVSQMAIFEKTRSFYQPPNQAAYMCRVQDGAHEMIERVEYPNFIETRTPEEITIMEFNYYVSNFVITPSKINEYVDMGVEEVKIPLKIIQSLPRIPEVVKDNQEALVNILKTENNRIGIDEGEINVVINIREYEEANFAESSNSDSEDDGMSEIIFNMNQVYVDATTFYPPQENWEEY